MNAGYGLVTAGSRDPSSVGTTSKPLKRAVASPSLRLPQRSHSGGRRFESG